MAFVVGDRLVGRSSGWLRAGTSSASKRTPDRSLNPIGSGRDIEDSTSQETSMISASRFRSRTVLLVTAGALLATTAVGCSQEPKVIRPYTPAAGVSGANDTVKLRNIVLVAQDGQARLSGMAVASADDAITGVTGSALKPDNSVAAALAPSTTRVPLTRQTSVNLTDAGIQVSSPKLTEGLLASVTITFSQGEPITLQTPVVSASHADFSPAAPTPIHS